MLGITATVAMTNNHVFGNTAHFGGGLFFYRSENATLTSNEILDNLVGLFMPAHRRLLQRTPLLVISERMHSHARQRGFETLLLAKQASDRAILEALMEWNAGHLANR